MEGEPIGAAKKALRTIIETLADGDIFGLVVFSTYVRDAFPIQVINAGTRLNAQNAASSLGDEERRNTLDGIKHSIALFERFKSQDAAGRYIFLITNGNPDKGVTDHAEVLKQTIELAGSANAGISTFGFRYFDRSGSDFDEDLLFSIADASGGRYHFIDSPDDILTRLANETSRICNASARNVTIEITPPGRDSRIVNIEGGRQGDNGRIVIGDMAPSETRQIIFDIEGRPKRQGDCEVRAYHLESDGQTEREARAFLDIPVISGVPTLNPAYAPRIIARDFQMSLAETSENILENRNQYVKVFRERVNELEQENVILDSDYLRGVLEYYKTFERTLSNSAVEYSVVRKMIKYKALQMLMGE
jgi:hypothetical protein